MQEFTIKQTILDYRSKEAFKTLRTNIEFSGEDTKVIFLTSTTPNEGKSTVSFELAQSFAQNGMKTLLIDADLRKSVMKSRGKKGKVKYGLTHYLSGKTTFENALCVSDVDNFYMIFAGPVPPNPSELLGNDRFKNMIEASERIERSARFDNDTDKMTAKRIIKSLISSRSIAEADNGEAESRIDYLADRLGIERADIIRSIQIMRNDGILADTKDLTAYIKKTDTENKSLLILKKYHVLENFLLNILDDSEISLNYKELNDKALSAGVKSSTVNSIKTLLYYWTISNYIDKEQDAFTNKVTVVTKCDVELMKKQREKSYKLADIIIRYLFKSSNHGVLENDEILVGFSIIELQNVCKKCGEDVSTTDIEKTLLFLSKISSVKLEGGFLVLYSGMKLKRLVMDNKIRYKNEDYKQLNEFYKQKIQQIHIVGEYANMMVRSYEAALKFVNDYFQMDYKKFLSVYFKGERATEIERNITPEKYRQLFDTLSERQLEIIKDDTSQYIVCTAGPGSGKTRVLVHKLASLLMLTFSRAAALEFKNRLRELIGNAAYFIEVKTFHSYCFDLLGKIGNIKDSENVVRDAGALIRSDDIDLGKVTKTVLVIDEAQDMDANEFSLVEALMERNDELRVIAVGDDDQNIYQFRGSDSKYLRKLITDYNAKQYDLVENYRSSRSIVNFANCFVKEITERLKTADISAVTNQNGEVRFVKHTGSYIENALIDDVISTYDGGTTCVLTNTNDETLVVFGILKQRGVEAKLIQSIGSLDIYNIAELRYFIKKLQLTDDTAVISNEQWDNAVYELQTAYSDSTCLPLMLDILNTFNENNKKLYRSDFEIFLHESRLEDFYKAQFILKLKSGTELEVEGRRLYCNYCGEKYPVAQFSRDCSNRIQSITQKGYTINSARIRYIVAWKGENDERETAIILPDVDLKLG